MNFEKKGFWPSHLNECPELLCGLSCDHSWSQTITFTSAANIHVQFRLVFIMEANTMNPDQTALMEQSQTALMEQSDLGPYCLQ